MISSTTIKSYGYTFIFSLLVILLTSCGKEVQSEWATHLREIDGYIDTEEELIAFQNFFLEALDTMENRPGSMYNELLTELSCQTINRINYKLLDPDKYSGMNDQVKLGQSKADSIAYNITILMFEIHGEFYTRHLIAERDYTNAEVEELRAYVLDNCPKVKEVMDYQQEKLLRFLNGQ